MRRRYAQGASVAQLFLRRVVGEMRKNRTGFVREVRTKLVRAPTQIDPRFPRLPQLLSAVVGLASSDT